MSQFLVVNAKASGFELKLTRGDAKLVATHVGLDGRRFGSLPDKVRETVETWLANAKPGDKLHFREMGTHHLIICTPEEDNLTDYTEWAV